MQQPVHYIGLDLAWGPNGATGVAVIDPDARLLHDMAEHGLLVLEPGAGEVLWAYRPPTAELEAELTRLGKDFEFHSYEGAGHSFFSTDRPAYRPEAATDGWKRIFAFYERHLQG